MSLDLWDESGMTLGWVWMSLDLWDESRMSLG
jgi:hypothetical protein